MSASDRQLALILKINYSAGKNRKAMDKRTKVTDELVREIRMSQAAAIRTRGYQVVFR